MTFVLLTLTGKSYSHKLRRYCTWIGRMSVQSIVQSLLTAFNSLGRSRKLLLIILALILFLYFFGPYLFGYRNYKQRYQDPNSVCETQNLVDFQSRMNNLDAFHSGDFEDVPPSKRMAYVGNGNIAAALGSEKGLYIRLNRALSQPINFWPVVQTRLEGSKKKSTILDVKSGLAYKMQVLSTGSGCINVGSQLYAHRSRPALLVQDIRIQNPSSLPIVVEMDQIGASGWEHVEVSDASFTTTASETIKYKIYSSTVPLLKSDKVIAIAVAAVSIESTTERVEANSIKKFHLLTAVHYTQPMLAEDGPKYLPDCVQQAKGELEKGLQINEKLLRQEHTHVWGKLWYSGFSISHSKASGAINGDRINRTLYYVLSNAPAPLHNVMSTAQDKANIEKILYFPDNCYSGHSTLKSDTLWIEPEDESQIARVVTTWMITLEKLGCKLMVGAGAEGILQAMLLSVAPLHFQDQHLEMTSVPKDLHRDLYFRRINYGNNTHVNISVTVGDDNKATIDVALDRNDRPYFGCDAGCLDSPVQLSKEWHKFPVKLTDPITSVLYITSDHQHMQELKHAIHVKEINEAPAHEHHVIALHKHGHHFGGLPTIFWVSIAVLIIVFHLFLFKLIYNEYCQSQDRYARSRYSL